jgi:preprotein translocase subunit SecA
MFALLARGTFYPQRMEWEERRFLDRVWDRSASLARKQFVAAAWRQRGFVRRVLRAQRRIETLDDAGRAEDLRELRFALRRDGPGIPLLAQAFAHVRWNSRRILGMAHHAVQLRGGYLMAQGFLAEMDTGEGKTLTATLPAAAMALCGYQVQVVTVNDYLAERDCDHLAPLYAALGLSCAVVREDSDPPARQAAYACDITYCTGKTLTFDYLKDRIAMQARVRPLHMFLDHFTGRWQRNVLLPGLQYVIVDEADSVLIDEARTPLIISGVGDGQNEEAFYRQAMELARLLEPEAHFLRDPDVRSFDLTRAGREYLQSIAEDLGGLWRNTYRREEAVLQALSALHLFNRDQHYIVQDEKILIVDEQTGRTMPDRAWERGTHQLIEIKEDVPLSPPRLTLAKISFQLFFQRYLRLSGMSGTVREVGREMRGVYRVSVVRVPPHRPSRRRCLGRFVCADAEAKWARVSARIQELIELGRPVLVGTQSIANADTLSRILEDAGVVHQVLHARQDEAEARIVERAGQSGQVTIATNMAGRGTDIKLPQEVVVAGGLHVILTERHENRRIDRQLIGRCARQGEPGSWEEISSLDDELVRHFWSPVRDILRSGLRQWPEWSVMQVLTRIYYRLAQIRVERQHRRGRARLLRAEFKLRRSLSFSGRME